MTLLWRYFVFIFCAAPTETDTNTGVHAKQISLSPLHDLPQHAHEHTGGATHWFMQDRNSFPLIRPATHIPTHTPQHTNKVSCDTDILSLLHDVPQHTETHRWSNTLVHAVPLHLYTTCNTHPNTYTATHR